MLGRLLNSPAETLISIFSLMVGATLFMLLAIRISRKRIYYGYVAALFYVDYLKLLFPHLPIGIIPDLLLFLFMIRVILFESGQIRRIFSSRPTLILSFVLFGYLIFNFLEIFNPILPTPMLGLQAFRGLAKITLFYWATLLVMDSRPEIFRFLRFLAANIFVVFLFSFKQILFGFADYELVVYSPGTIRRIYSLSTNAAVFSMVLGIGAVYWFAEGVIRRRFVGILICFTYLMMSTLTFHRAPLIAALVMVTWLAVANMRQTWRLFLTHLHHLIFFMILVSAVLGGLLIVPLNQHYEAMRHEIVTRLTQTGEGVHEKGLNVRVRQIPPAIDAIRRYPLGGGLGYTQLRFGKELDQVSVVKGLNNSNFQALLPMGTGDNSYLSVALETGWFGLFYFVLVLMWAALLALWNLSKARQDVDARQIISFSIGTMGIILISIPTSSTYFLSMVGSSFWMAAALAQAALETRDI